tara:strand:+ start:688 stop:1110 length:423 start_codon:yes stop_codon:yes gene_type:complete
MFLINKTFKMLSAVLIFLSLSTFSQLSNAGELLVYSSTDADNLKHYMDEFQKQHPDIKVNVVRESTGTMAAKMMAEKDNPQADFLFEMAATVALNMEAEGMFVEYHQREWMRLINDMLITLRLLLGLETMVGLVAFVGIE